MKVIGRGGLSAKLLSWKNGRRDEIMDLRTLLRFMAGKAKKKTVCESNNPITEQNTTEQVQETNTGSNSPQENEQR